jgi:hypothetical protein
MGAVYFFTITIAARFLGAQASSSASLMLKNLRFQSLVRPNNFPGITKQARELFVKASVPPVPLQKPTSYAGSSCRAALAAHLWARSIPHC